MTVKELRDRLATLDDNAIVMVTFDGEAFGDAYNVKDGEDDTHVVIEAQPNL